MDASSISSSFGLEGVPDGSCDTFDTKWRVPSPRDLLLAMVARDHDSAGWTAAFFKESKRRTAMIGMKVAPALWDVSWY